MPPHLHPDYFATHFRDAERPEQWPPSFAILTAYQPTGSTWDQQTNESADAELKSYLESQNLPHWRLTGFSPESGHAEPGWAVSLDFLTACEIGRMFVQDAIHFVKNGSLYVSLCDPEHRLLNSVGPFWERLSDI